MTKPIFQSVEAEAYSEGSAAYWRRQPKTKNPWGERHGLHSEWNSGYEDAERSNLRALAELDAAEASLTESRLHAEARMLDSLDSALCRSMLREATALVRKHFPDVKLREAWTYHFHGDHWEFHGPDGFYWHGSADGAYDARYHGWMAWLSSKGLDLD